MSANIPVIIDPGTYCYTGNMEMRRLFRSTAYHNTVVVDGEEQVPIHNSMFALVNPSGDIRVLDWKSNESFDFLTAEHTGYQRLAKPVVHRRCFHLDKEKHRIVIEDSFHGKGKHHIGFYFHLDTATTCDIIGGKAYFLKNDRPVLSMQAVDAYGQFMITDGWVSRAYNHKEPAQILSWTPLSIRPRPAHSSIRLGLKKILLQRPKQAQAHKKIHLIAAARPNFMKIAPLYHALAKQPWAETTIVHTGQHYDLNMSDVFFKDL